MKTTIAALMLAMCVGCGKHDKSDGTAPSGMIIPIPPTVAEMRPGDTACTYYWFPSVEKHVWLARAGELIHKGSCSWWLHLDIGMGATVTKVDEYRWSMVWRGGSRSAEHSDEEYQSRGYFRVTELGE